MLLVSVINSEKNPGQPNKLHLYLIIQKLLLVFFQNLKKMSNKIDLNVQVDPFQVFTFNCPNAF